MRCRGCRAAGLDVLYDFGELPLGGYLLPTAAAARRAPRFRNAVAICRRCGLVQQASDAAEGALSELVYAQYQPTYSTSARVRAYQERYLDDALGLSSVTPGGAVIEIGANDGFLLGLLQGRRLSPVGFDPSIDPALERRGYRVFREYFGTAAARRYVDAHGGVKLVLSRHTLEHVFDPLDFLAGVETVLARDGIAVLEVPYLHSQMATNQFQSMGVQHVCFFTVESLTRMLAGVGLETRETWLSPMDGGSMVVCAAKRLPGRRGPNRGRRIEDVEQLFRLREPSAYRRFFADVAAQRVQIRDQLRRYAERHGPAIGYGAGGKGQGLLNVLGLGTDAVRYVIDDTPGYPGRFIPGVASEVVAWNDPRAIEAGLVLVTAPTHVREIVRRDRRRLGRRRVYAATAPRFHIIAA